MVDVRYWQAETWPGFQTKDPERTVAVLPVGAIEQHGPHLPLSTDTIIAEDVVRLAAERLHAHLPFYILPTLSIGKSNEHLEYPGTLTLSAETLMRVWLEVGQSVARAGVRKLVFVNAHGGQTQVMEIVARELRVQENMFCVAASWWQMGLPEGLFPAPELIHGVHGGTVETSMVLYLHPELVRMELAEDFVPSTVEINEKFEKLRILGGPGAGWQVQDLHPAGVAGNARAATAELGKAVVDHVADGIATLLRETVEYPLSNLKAGPRSADKA